MNIGEMLKAECSVVGCNEKQFIFMGLPSLISEDVQESFPFCQKHGMNIMMGKLRKFTLKNGYVYVGSETISLAKSQAKLAEKGALA